MNLIANSTQAVIPYGQIMIFMNEEDTAMRMRKIVIMTCFMLCASLVSLGAAPIAEETHQKLQAMDLSAMSMDRIIQEYDKLYGHVTTLAGEFRKEMEAARGKGDRSAYREAYEGLASLSRFAMGKEETDRVLARILQEPVEKQVGYAAWLYDHSAYYRPVLSIDFSISGEGYRYSYAQQLQQKPGTRIVLPDASQIRVDRNRAGILSGWGMTPQQLDYRGGDQIAMPLTSQTLHAIWSSAVQFTDEVTHTDIIHEPVDEGEIVEIPSLTAPDSSWRFIGWYDPSSRTLLEDETTYTVSGKGAAFEAVWKRLSVEAINTLYYGFDRLPAKTQLGVGFSISNQGNTILSGLTARLSTESPHVTFLRDTVEVRDLPPGTYRTNNSRFATTTQGMISGEGNTFRFVIDESTPSGTRIPFTLTMTDGDGERWQSEVTFTVL
jgi:hypothetical protein